MFIAKVIGNVVATKKEESLVGCRFLIIQKLTSREEPAGDEMVAVDYIGAGKGEIVLVSTGSGARVDQRHSSKPIDAAIVGIIDEIQS